VVANDHIDDEPAATLQEASRYRVPAAARTLSVLELLAGATKPLGVSEIARQLKIPKSSSFALLSTLEDAGYVRRNAEDEWMATLRLYHLGIRVAQNIDILIVAQPIINELSDSTGMTAHLGMFDGRSVVYALKVEPRESMIKFDTYPGKVASVHLTAIGRAIASVLEERDLMRLLGDYDFDGGFNSRIRSRTSFMAEMGRVRTRGYSLENEEETVGVACLAAPLSYAAGQGAAAVGVTALAAQVREASVDVVAERVKQAAESLSALLGIEMVTR
jgi:IclR family transcriptional regulator, KDG regulon repressor